MTVCGNKLSGVCGASCTFFNICRNNEIANLPKSNIEWMREASLEELADVIADFYLLGYTHGHNKMDITSRTKWTEWLKQPHTTGGAK